VRHFGVREERGGREHSIPSGTVAFLFTDVEGSTSLWQDHPQAMSAALARHDEILRTAIDGHSGFVFSTAGDAFAAAFDSASNALKAAIEAQRALCAESWGEAVIRVRMGLNIGVAEERGGNYLGDVVNRTARIMSLAEGGQVLLSSTAQEAIDGRLDADIELRPLGERKLKSLSRPEHLYQALGSGLPDRPVTIITETADGNLPSGVVGFVGRTDDIENLRARVAPGRVVTLTGIGGVGKTQLSTRVATTLTVDFPDGVWWCDLTPLAAPELIPSAVAATLRFNIKPGIDPIDAVVEALARRHMLLVVDNCEHLLSGAAAMIRAVARGCPNVALLATSREPLGIAEEMVWPLRPLEAATEGVDLLVRRAAAADASIDPSVWDRADLVELCERLDGIPLAIEMAAARLRSMSPRQILNRLEDRFRVLRNRRREGAQRHQTLLATLDWSYRLLEPDEQILLDRLAVFADAFDLEATEAVCADRGAGLDPLDIADLMGALIGKSLVTMIRTRTKVRYRLLETIRHYAMAHLDERNEATTMRRRHAEIYLAEAGEAAERIRDQRFWSARAFFEDNWNELVAAITWAVGIGDSELVANLLMACRSYATSTGKSEIGELARTAVELPEAAGITYALAAFFADGSEQVRFAEAGLRLQRFRKYEQQFLYSQLAAGRATTGVKGTIDAILHATHHARDGGDPLDLAYWEAILAEGMATRRPDDALRHAHSASSLLEGRRDHPYASGALGRLAGYEARSGRFEAALQLCEETTHLAESAGVLVFRAYAVALAARVSAALQQDGAAARLRDAIDDARRSGWWLNVWPVMSAAGRWFEGTGRLAAAATIAGHFEQRGRTREGYDLVPAQVDLSGEVGAHRIGARMSADELVDFVLGELAEADARRS